MGEMVEGTFLLNKQNDHPLDPLDASWELVSGNFKATISKIEMHGVTIPKALLEDLLTEKSEELRKIIRFIASLGLTPAAAKYIFQVYATKGIKDSWAVLREYEKNKPTDKARIYKGSGYSVKETNPLYFTITNGKIGCCVYVDLWRIDKSLRKAAEKRLESLPFFPNVYFQYTRAISLHLEHFEQLLTFSGRKLDDACERLWRLSKIQRYLYNPRINKILNGVLFEDDTQELKRAEKDAIHRYKRDNIFEELSKPFYFDDGSCLVRVGDCVYYVTGDKKVFELNYSSNVALREAVFRAVRKSKIPTQLEKVYDPPEIIKEIWRKNPH